MGSLDFTELPKKIASKLKASSFTAKIKATI
jgi:hypothetical protein